MSISGYMAGLKLDRSDGGTNYICLTDDPTVNDSVKENLGLSRIHGVGYVLYTNDDPLNFFSVPCALCQVEAADHHVIMVPGT